MSQRVSPTSSKSQLDRAYHPCRSIRGILAGHEGELVTTPEDVARVVLFLCGDAVAQIVGQTIVVDGDRTLPA